MEPMRTPSLRKNITLILGLYAVAFIVAAAFPLADSGRAAPTAVLAAVSGDKPASNAKTPVATTKTGSAEKRPSAGKLTPEDGAKPTFDPVKANGPVFEGWTKPKLAIVISGHQDGYL